MSEQDNEKTESPTPKRLEDAHRKGDVIKSQDLRTWFMLLGITVVVGLLGTSTSRAISVSLVPFLSDAHRMDVDPHHLMAVLLHLCRTLAVALALPMLALMAVAIAGTLVQHKPLVAWSKLKLEFSHISPKSGVKRLISMQALVEYAKSLAKILVVGIVLISVIWPERQRLDTMADYEPIALLGLAQDFTMKLILVTLGIMAFVAMGDYLHQWQQLMKRLRMSRQEIRDEMKQSDGDPMVKARIRQIRIERSRRRMMAAVPSATVVIANPTHYAVALLYDPDSMAAPRCVAKGVDAVALRIRSVAEENMVPVVENPPLARALHATVELDQDIPPEQYKAVAQVIGYVMQIKGRAASASARSSAAR